MNMRQRSIQYPGIPTWEPHFNQQKDDHGGITSTTNQMPPQNISISPQQHHSNHQMSHTLLDPNTGIIISMSDQHAAHQLGHAHGMLDLSETGSSLEHLAGGGHSSQSLARGGHSSLAGLAAGRASDHPLENLVAHDGRRQLHPLDRISGLSDGASMSMRQINSSDRDVVNRPLSRLEVSSLSDRQSQPMRNLTPVGMDGRTGQNGGGMVGNSGSDGRGSVGHGSQSLSLGGNNGAGVQDSGNTNIQALNFSPDQSSQNLLDSASSMPRRGRPPSLGGVQHNIVDQQQHGAQALSSHMGMRGSLSDHPSHSHHGLVDHHHQHQIIGRDSNGNNLNGRSGLSVFRQDNNNGQMQSRPGSTLLAEANSHSDVHDHSRSVYSASSISGDRGVDDQSGSLIEETIASVASNLNKSSPDGGIMPGPLPPNALLGLDHLGSVRASSAASNLSHRGDESLVDLVGRHHTQSIHMLSERASQSLSGLMDENSMSQSPGHSQGRELDRTHPCLTCLKLFRSKQQLAQHSLVHTGIRKHICSFCDRAFKQLSHLQQHVRIHTGERKYMCKFCERGFKQLSHLQKHTRIHTGERNYVCSICEKRFKQLSHLQQHFRIHTGERKYICSCCERGFKQLSHLQQHFRIHTGERKYVCQLCNRAFKQMTHLQQHHRIHTGERKYVCQICSRAFKQLTHLQKHHVVHTGERKFVCQCCDRAFKQQTHLQQHYRIHTGEKPYRCKFENCERAFAQLSNLQHHMRNHDDQVKKEATRIHKCQICHRCYTNESSLKSHTLKMHIHIKPIDQHAAPPVKKRKKRKNRDLYGNAPTMVPVSSSSDGSYPGAMPGMKTSDSRPHSPTSSSDDNDEIIFVGEQVGPPRLDNFAGLAGSLGGQGQMLQGAGERSIDMGHQIPFSGMGNFSRGTDPLALLASANRFTLQENMMAGFGGTLNSFSEQFSFRDAALLNSRFGDLRGPSQGTSFDDRFSSGNCNQQQLQRDHDGFGSHVDLNNRGNGGASSNTADGNSGDGGDDNMQVHNDKIRNQISAHNQNLLRSAGISGLGSGVGAMMQGGLLKQIKQEPLEYFSTSCHGGEQFAGMGVGAARGFLSPQHIISSHLRGQLPSLNVPLLRDHFPHNQMLPQPSSAVSSGTSSTPVSSIASSSSPMPLACTTPSTLVSLPLPLSHMGLYHQSQFPTPQRMGGLHPSPASTPSSSQMSVGGSHPAGSVHGDEEPH